jgi:hypothetical protein
VFVENTVSKCSVLTESSTSTQTPPSPLNAMLSSILNILIHKFLILFKFFLNILSLNCILNIHTNIHPSLLNAMFGINSILSFNNVLIHSSFKCFLILRHWKLELLRLMLKLRTTKVQTVDIEESLENTVETDYVEKHQKETKRCHCQN